MKIENIHLHGGNPNIQIADQIINSSDVFDQTDRDLIQLIHDNVDNEIGRKELLDSLKSLKSNETPEKEKFESKSRIKTFFDSVTNEAGKQVVKELIENGSDLLGNLNV